MYVYIYILCACVYVQVAAETVAAATRPEHALCTFVI